jgi:hypothetical protein
VGGGRREGATAGAGAVGTVVARQQNTLTTTIKITCLRRAGHRLPGIWKSLAAAGDGVLSAETGANSRQGCCSKQTGTRAFASRPPSLPRGLLCLYLLRAATCSSATSPTHLDASCPPRAAIACSDSTHPATEWSTGATCPTGNVSCSHSCPAQYWPLGGSRLETALAIPSAKLARPYLLVHPAARAQSVSDLRCSEGNALLQELATRRQQTTSPLSRPTALCLPMCTKLL